MNNYLFEKLGLKCKLSEWEKINSLPMFLKNKIEYYSLTIENKECVVMKVKMTNFKLSVLFNNVVQLRKYTDKPVVLWLETITSYQRKALIKNRISFIVPNSQLYLPFVGMIFKEHLSTEQRVPEKLSPKGQIVLLYLIYNKIDKEIYQTQIMSDLTLSSMDVSRAVKELANLEIVTDKTIGKQKVINPVSVGRDLYEISKKYIRNPIQKTIYVEDNKTYLKLTKAGETSLSERTMLNPPKSICVALDKSDRETIDSADIIDIDFIMPGKEYVELQIWRYNPQLFADKNGVDVISLAASLNDCVDERVEAAVEEMLEKHVW